MKHTYVLFAKNGRSPTVHHPSLKSARDEANRLIDHCNAGEVIICRFVEGLRSVASKAVLTENPLPNTEKEPPF